MTGEKENASTAAATTTEARETTLQDGNTAPTIHSTNETGNGQAIDLISVGRANAQTAAVLARVSGISRREVVSQIQAARLNGSRICSSPGRPAGFWIAENPAEYEQNIRELSRRAREQRQTIEAMEQSLARWIEQERVEALL